MTKAPLSVTAADESKVYGAANPELTGKVVGAKNGDVLTATYTVTAVRESPVGSYDITAKVTGAALSNYDVTLKGAKLTVTRAPLSVTVDNTTKVYGDENPAFTVTYGGFVLGEDAGVLGGKLEYATEATTSSAVDTTGSRRPGWPAATTPSATPRAPSR